MRFQKYILCAVVALTAFGVAVGLLDIGGFFTNFFRTKEPEVKAVEPVAEKKTADLYETLPPEVTVVPSGEGFGTGDGKGTIEPKSDENSEKTEPEFCPDGEFYFAGDSPKGFKDFKSLTIQTKDYEQVSEENDYEGEPIPPKGYIFGNKNREFNFVRVSISPKQLSFETEAIKGVSYKFTGKYVDEEIKVKKDYGYEYTELVEIKGTLIKMRDGKKIAEIEAKFARGGC
jgi:hypothetical protein